jgi:RecB family exonuclease
VSRPQELLVLSWHAAADDGTPQMRSLFVDDVCDLFEDSLASERVERLLGCVERPPGAVEVRLDGPRRGRPIEDRPGPLRDEQLLAELRAHTWSASSLEVWMSCPMRWLVERMLRARDLDPDPEPLARGGLAHAALKDTLTALRVRSGSARITPERLDLARELLGEALAENAPSFELSSAGERRPGLRRRLEADLDRYLQHAAATAGAEDDALEPTHVELGFGFADDDGRGQASGLPAFDIGGGVMLRGRIDRVDVGERGEAVVYDYKGRNAPPAAKWIAQGDLQVALYMRVIEGLLGLRAAGGFYQPLTGSDLRARGVLDGDSGVQIDAVSGDRRDGPDVRTLLAEAAETAREAAAQAGRGALEARPQTCSFKGGCAYPTICRCERS